MVTRVPEECELVCWYLGLEAASWVEESGKRFGTVYEATESVGVLHSSVMDDCRDGVADSALCVNSLEGEG